MIKQIFKSMNFDKYKEITIRKIPDEIKDEVEDISDMFQKKGCYLNSYYAMVNDDVYYCEGWVLIMGGIPIEHAWCEYNGQFFDPTTEYLFKERSDFSDYHLIQKTKNKKTAMKWVQDHLRAMQRVMRGGKMEESILLKYME